MLSPGSSPWSMSKASRQSHALLFQLTTCNFCRQYFYGPCCLGEKRSLVHHAEDIGRAPTFQAWIPDEEVTRHIFAQWRAVAPILYIDFGCFNRKCSGNCLKTVAGTGSLSCIKRLSQSTTADEGVDIG